MADSTQPPAAPRPPRRCPICRRPVVESRYRPFCSARCQQVDLGRWLAGDYAIPGDTGEAPEEDSPP